jgi:hypothetical protein
VAKASAGAASLDVTSFMSWLEAIALRARDFFRAGEYAIALGGDGGRWLREDEPARAADQRRVVSTAARTAYTRACGGDRSLGKK